MQNALHALCGTFMDSMVSRYFKLVLFSISILYYDMVLCRKNKTKSVLFTSARMITFSLAFNAKVISILQFGTVLIIKTIIMQM